MIYNNYMHLYRKQYYHPECSIIFRQIISLIKLRMRMSLEHLWNVGLAKICSLPYNVLYSYVRLYASLTYWLLAEIGITKLKADKLTNRRWLGPTSSLKYLTRVSIVQNPVKVPSITRVLGLNENYRKHQPALQNKLANLSCLFMTVHYLSEQQKHTINTMLATFGLIERCPVLIHLNTILLIVDS